MLNELKEQLGKLTRPGDRVVCAVSGGADSMALLWGLYLLREDLGFTLSAAHFNHRLRGVESDSDEHFVREFCDRFDIQLYVGSADVKPGKKGLEAAAREARYAFLNTLGGKIATAHTADDNAETVLMHLVRGTGLKGLGGIAPVNGALIRPMLNITRRQVEAFLDEYHIPHIEDSSNAGDAFLRNRIRHRIMPLLQAENPRLAENVSAMAQRLRKDEQALAEMADYEQLPAVAQLKQLAPAVRSRMLERFLKENGVREPEAQHIALAESLVFSSKPSAWAEFPGGVTVCRNYDRLEVLSKEAPLGTYTLPENGVLEIPGWRISVSPAQEIINTQDVFTVQPKGKTVVRCRCSGDAIKLPAGTKTVKKLFIDRKIPAHQRLQIPVISDDAGLLGVYGVGADQTRTASTLPAIQIRLQKSR
ncbi:MAG: tRNA lysidine(34) synthetase TilS [Oscillospiraceae bacterium]|nr:tRNA lysidine(34) synthetase TilS [Oscillospiraceae bacterium]